MYTIEAQNKSGKWVKSGRQHTKPEANRILVLYRSISNAPMRIVEV